MEYFGNVWIYKFKFSGLSSFYDSNNWGRSEENLRGMGEIFIFFLDGLIWNYPRQPCHKQFNSRNNDKKRETLLKRVTFLAIVKKVVVQ